MLPAIARTAIGEERERLWALMRQIWPAYDEYQTRTDREIPVVVLTPQGLTPWCRLARPRRPTRAAAATCGG